MTLFISATIWMTLFLGCGSDLSPEEQIVKLKELVEDEDFEEAEELLRDLHVKRPTDSTVMRLAGIVFIGLNQPDSAYSYARKFSVLYPKDANGYRFLYEVSGLKEDYDMQIWALSQLSYVEGDKDKYYAQIVELNFMRGEFGKAISGAEWVLAKDPENSGMLFILANSLATIGNVDSAVAILTRLDEKNPNRVEIIANLASYLASKKDYDQAEVHFKKLIELYPDYLPGWYGLGNVLAKKGDTTGAIRAYQQVYMSDPSFLSVDSVLHELDPVRY
jgi:tetratricopeptide (TPR) repeat protein